MRKLTFLLITAILFLSSYAHAEVALKYGKTSGKVSYVNNNNHPELQEPLPLGPLTFRKIGKEIYVADSVGGKIIKAGKDIQEVILSVNAGEMLIDDIAFAEVKNNKPSAFWVIEALSNSLKKFSFDGKLIETISSDKFVQPFRIEIGQNNYLYVADKGAKTIFVFNQKLKLIKSIAWEWSGFAISKKGDLLYRICYLPEKNISFLVAQNLKDELLIEQELKLGEHLNARLWAVDETNQEFFITYETSKTKMRKTILAKVNFSGEIKSKKEITLPYAMNRFLEISSGGIWLACADFSLAPKGELKIEKISFP
jgi:hypothetical protein